MSSWEEVYEAFKDIAGENKGQDISQVTLFAEFTHLQGYFFQAFFAMKHMKEPPPREVLREMADAAIEHAREMMPISLTNVLHACARLRFHHPPLLSEWQHQLQDPRVSVDCC